MTPDQVGKDINRRLAVALEGLARAHGTTPQDLLRTARDYLERGARVLAGRPPKDGPQEQKTIIIRFP